LWSLAYAGLTGIKLREVYPGPGGREALATLTDGEVRAIAKLQRGACFLPAYGHAANIYRGGVMGSMNPVNVTRMLNLVYDRKDLTEYDARHILYFFPQMRVLVKGMLKLGYPWIQGGPGYRTHRRKISDEEVYNNEGRGAVVDIDDILRTIQEVGAMQVELDRDMSSPSAMSIDEVEFVDPLKLRQQSRY